MRSQTAWTEARSQSHLDHSSLRGKGPKLIGTALYGAVRRVVWDRGANHSQGPDSWKEIPRKRGLIQGRSSPNPPPAQVTKPAPRRIGGTQAHKLLIRGLSSNERKPCHLYRRLTSTRHHVIIAVSGVRSAVWRVLPGRIHRCHSMQIYDTYEVRPPSALACRCGL
jgi:hypothetical protein